MNSGRSRLDLVGQSIGPRVRRAWGVVCLVGLGALAGCRPSGASLPPEALPDPAGAVSTPPGTAPQPAEPSAGPAIVASSLEAVLASDDPRSDGWESEAFSAATEKQLKQLALLLAEPERLTADALSEWVADDLVSSVIVPAELSLVLEQGLLRVREGRCEPPSETPSAGDGRSAFLTACRELATRIGAARHGHAAFKTVAVDLSAELPATSVVYSACGERDGQRVQTQAVWRCVWSREPAGTPPRLLKLGVEQFREVELACGSGPVLRDISDQVFAECPAWSEQLRWGQEHWAARIPRSAGMVESSASGLALGDVNGDGLDDLYLAQPGGLPNRMLVCQPAGTLRDISAASGSDFLDLTTGVLFADLDNDGDQDLLALVASTLVGLENDGQGHFTNRGTIAELEQTFSLAAADYDRDGLLDVYVTQYAGGGNVGVLARTRNPLPFHDANNAHPNKLFRNEGGWRFRDVTVETGLDENNRRWSFACGWEDYDQDGDQDLYVANDFGRNNLYLNDGGRFRDVAAATGVEDVAASMSVSWGDYDRDGWMDLYVGNMWSSAGQRVTYQPGFQTGLSELTRGLFQRLARGNSLFRNRGDGQFTDLSEPLGVTLGRWAWSSSFVDLNGDGWEDIYVANGMITNADPHDL